MPQYFDVLLPGIVVIGLLWIGVQSRYMLVPITLFALLLLLAPLIVVDFGMKIETFYSISGFCGAGLLISYFLRFKRVPDKHLIHYLKLFGIALGASALILSTIFEGEGYMVTCLIFICGVYYYDRLIQPAPAGSRKQMIALSVMGVLCVLFIIYALVQRTQAIRQREIAIEMQKQAEKNEKKAIEAEREAMQQAEKAREEAALAREAAEDCQKKK